MKAQAESGIERRVFVVGVPRSGTTLVQSLLAAHSRMTSFTESHFFDRHFTLLPLVSIPILAKDPGPRLREFLAENGAGTRDAFRRSPGLLLPFRARAVARRFLSILDELALERGRCGWIEKTPRHLRYVPFLESVSGRDGRSRFVHVIRDGLEVVASLREASRNWERPYDLDTCVRRWNADVRFSASRVGSPADHFVFYEELTSRPAATLRRLVGELGLAWEPELLERYADASRGLVTDEEAWKAGVARGIRPSATSRRALSGEERERVRRSLNRRLYEELAERTVAHG